MRALWRWRWTGFIGLVAFVFGGFLAWQARESSRTAIAEKETTGSAPETRPLLSLSAEEARRAGLVVQRLEPTRAGETVELFGTVEVNRDKLARVVSPVAGRLVTINGNLGDVVRAGGTLALVESSESGDARAAYAQAQAELALAASSLDRIRNLVSGGSLARKEELKARADYEKARAAVNAAAAKLQAIGIEPGTGPGGRLALTAPFAGTVVEKAAVLGENTQAYQPLFGIADLSSLWIQANIYERDLGRVSVGAPASATVAAFPDRTFPGKVNYVSSILDPDTRTAKARIEVANPDGALKPGMFASVSVDTSAPQAVLRVPETALVLLQGQLTAFVRAADGFRPRPVETGKRRGGEIVVTSGLEPGDEVVTVGAYALKARLLKSQIEAE
jgi:cobalt-zinc-cadmium efflux system membrane fusion protein